VCAAVEHAHRHFIVHRDLKPGNILIDQSGAPKLLDFGVSKLLLAQPDAVETQDVGMMTPDYASPEQILGEPVTVASDIYSLGAVLYELLSGARPHHIDKCTPLALERAICVDETVAPSTAAKAHRALARRLAGDLDNIVLHAMHKQPERRYPSVEQMAADIRRHLEHRPIVARPDSRAYRARKFVRRNRIAVALATVVAASLIGGTAVAMQQARLAQERSQEVRTLATRFVFDVEEAARELPGSLRVRQLIARTGLKYLGNLAQRSANDWPLQRELATAYLRLGELQGGVETSNLGDPAGALDSFGRASVLLDAVLNHSPEDRQASLDRMTVAHRMSDLHRQMGRLPLAVESTEDGLRRAEALLRGKPGDPDMLQYAAVFHLDLGRLRQQEGDLQRAATEIASGIALLRQLSSARPDQRETRTNIASSQARLGSIEAELGHREAALDSYRAGVAALEQLVRRYPDDTGTRHDLMLAYSHVGDVLGNPAYDNAGDTAGARVEYGRMVDVARFLHDADSSDMRARSDFGIALLRLGIVSPTDTKRSTLEQALGLLEHVARLNPQDKPNAIHKAWAEIELGDLCRAGGDHTSAARYYALGLATAEAVQAVDPRDSASQRWLVTAARELAKEQIRAGDPSHALATVDKAVQLGTRLQSTAPPGSVTIRSIVARAWQAGGAVHVALAEHERDEPRQRHRETARDWYQRSMAEWRKLEPLEGFTSLQRREMETTAAELTALDAYESVR
jgi:tetratricopeptide (TPR) repeat protein